jgi:predicted GNAT family acetyltransferase
MPDYNIVNNETEMQFEILQDGEKAYLTYRHYKRDLAFMHTLVPPQLEGRGIAGSLAKAAFEYAAKLHKQVIVFCPFVAQFLSKHTEYKKQLDPKYYGLVRVE